MNKFYTKDHEYVFIKNGIAILGISKYAQEQLGDIVFIELPKVGTIYKKGDEFAVIESVKAASEIYTPVDGEVIEVNNILKKTPEVINENSENDGWFIKIKISNPLNVKTLMDEEKYKNYIK